jgi:hypothetical protein
MNYGALLILSVAVALLAIYVWVAIRNERQSTNIPPKPPGTTMPPDQDLPVK